MSSQRSLGLRGPGAPDHLALIPMDMGAAAMDKAAPFWATELDLMLSFPSFSDAFSSLGGKSLC